MKTKFDIALEKLKADKMSKTVIAKRLDIPYQRLQGWLQKNARPSAEDAEKLLEYYEIKEKPPSEMESLTAVMIDRIAELMAEKNGTSITVERQRILRDVELLRKTTS